ncbi:MAG: PKD domain-containing protein [Chitinophagaceae bacterium]|nr:PKD domain-containing protein [Chitinophagaceae bacterium]
MKKIFTLLWLTITAFTFKATAQPGTNCNAEFAVQYINNLTVKFNPVITEGAPLVQHFWHFGDGSPVNQQVSPTHTYTLPGTYAVVHTIARVNQNNVPVCTQTFTRQVTINAACNLVVNFSWSGTAANPLTVAFQNLSVPLSNTDSITWNFGDNSTSHAVNPVHTYANPGTYNVCLTVIKIPTPTSGPCIRYICKTVIIPPPCNLLPNFNWTVDPNNSLRIQFHNLTTPVAVNDSVRWTFGDGTSSNAVNPVHNYTAPGTYTVCLKVTRYNSGNTTPCVREICKTIIVYPPCNLVVNFTSQPDPNHPLRIKFTNTSTPVHPTDSLRWTFGDGTLLSGVQSDPNVAAPTHNYANAGTYTVCLRVKKNNNTTTNTGCVREKCNTIVIPVLCNLVVNFTSQPDPNHPLRIKFTNTSTPIHPTDSLKWTFGDGTSISGVQSDPNIAAPTHNYTSAGNYTVCLRVKKTNNATTPAGCVREKCNTIVVPSPCNFNVNFSWRLDSVNQRKVYFTNLSTPPTAAAVAVWNFGDGSSATSWNAIHEYAQPGSYRVCLRIYPSPTSNCVREFCDTIYIPQPLPSCTQLSKYHYERFNNDNQKFKFTADYINPTLQYTWTFGDGTGSHDPVAIHRYAQPGVYTACLTVWRGPNCASTTCKEIRVLPQVNCDTAHVSYTYQRNPQMPNKVHFYANATLPILDQVWTISRLNGTITLPPVILHQNNPVYTFQDTGFYRVCLRATLLGGCVKEYCNYIRIEQVTNACLLQAFPNPASTTVNVNVYLSQPEMINAYVYNSLNVLVLSGTQQGHAGNNLVTLNVHNLAAGQYTIKLVYGNRVCYARFQKL